MSDPPESITCVECGGTARLLSFLPEDEPFDPDYPLAYRCADCLDRFDVVWGEASTEPGEH